jgi:hypothetical protein
LKTSEPFVRQQAEQARIIRDALPSLNDILKQQQDDFANSSPVPFLNLVRPADSIHRARDANSAEADLTR